MKKFSNYNKIIKENCTTADVNPGNSYPSTGVTNHLTPVGNIVTQIRNIFSPVTGIVASVAEDGYSVKLNSSKFVSKEEVNRILYDYTVMRNTCLAQQITSQGLDKIKLISVGQYFVVYFSPSDIKGAKPGKEPEPANLPCTEMLQYNIDETEILTLENLDNLEIVLESDDDEEMEDLTRKKIIELINSKDKVKAAKQFELLVTQQLELPREYYFAGVKSKDGDESIALRWKYTKKRPGNKTSEYTRSLINIYNDGEDGIWVQDFDKDSIVKLPDEVDKLIHTILDFLGASETNNPSVWSMKETEKKEEKKEDKKDEDEDKDNKDEKDEDTKKDKDNNEEDDLLGTSDDKKDDKSDDENDDDLL